MAKLRIFLAILLALVLIIRASDATTRILLADDKPITEKVSPSPAPNSAPVNKELNQNRLADAAAPPPDSDKTSEKKPNEGSDNRSEDKNGKKDDKKKDSDGPSKSREEGHTDTDKTQLEECDGLQKCKKHGWVACLQHSEIESKELVIIVQNSVENSLDVNIAVLPSVAADAKNLRLAKHSTQKVNISTGSTKNLTILLNSGEEECKFQIAMVPPVTGWIQEFPAYAKQLPPMYGAYLLFFALFIAGGIWGCCKFRNNRGRRAVDGVAYQQLEMGVQTQSATEIAESSNGDGWEESWNDDWDEEATVKPSPTSPNGHVSSNGLSSRSANKKNDWDIEWDD